MKHQVSEHVEKRIELLSDCKVNLSRPNITEAVQQFQILEN